MKNQTILLIALFSILTVITIYNFYGFKSKSEVVIESLKLDTKVVILETGQTLYVSKGYGDITYSKNDTVVVYISGLQDDLPIIKQVVLREDIPNTYKDSKKYFYKAVVK